MKLETLETVVGTAIAGELPLILGMNGIEMDTEAVKAAGEGLAKRVCAALVSRDLVSLRGDE